MKIKDCAKIEIQSGSGGNGCASFLRKKYFLGGPDGGNGGKGGNVYISASSHILDLSFYHKKLYYAENGFPGQKNKKSGKNGKDLILKVPVGTEVYYIINNIKKKIIIFSKDKEKYLILYGGKGGLGNNFFKNSYNTKIKKKTKGIVGKKLKIELYYYIFSHAMLIGLVNSGKTTILNYLANTKYLTSNYHGTTTDIKFGTIDCNFNKILFIDLPGIFKESKKDYYFLKHGKNTKVLFYVISCNNTLLKSIINNISFLINKTKEFFNKKKSCIILSHINNKQKKYITNCVLSIKKLYNIPVFLYFHKKNNNDLKNNIKDFFIKNNI